MKRMQGAGKYRYIYRLCSLAVIMSIILMCSCATRDIELSDEISAIISCDYLDSRVPLSVVEDMVHGSASDPVARDNIEMQFSQVLRLPETTLACKDFICRQLWIIGTDISLPEVESMLHDSATTDMARYALATNESPNAGRVLRDALRDTDGEMLIGIINTLGERREPESKKALELFLEHDDATIAHAARIASEKIDGIR